ncbi:MAG: hypothetical protein OXF56_21265 [Rhodobacteraceae bacterium]|nr:hypothetical protein [Paracoccaceae bacterium]
MTIKRKPALNTLKMSGAGLSGESAVTNRSYPGHQKSTGCIRSEAISARPGRRFRPPELAEPVLWQGNRSSGPLAYCQLGNGETVNPQAANAALAMAPALPGEPCRVVVITSRPDTAVSVANHVCTTVMVIGGTIRNARQSPRSRPLVSPFADHLRAQASTCCAQFREARRT